MIRKRPAKKAKNGYTYQVYFYYRDMFDKRKYYSKSGFLTKKEAQIHETEMKARLKEKGTLNQGTNKTFNDVFEEFMESEGKNLSLNTIRRKKVTFDKYIKNSFGNSKINLFSNYAFLQSIFNSLEEMTFSTVKTVRYIVKNVTSFAIKMEYIDSSPMNLVTFKWAEKEEKEKKIVPFETFIQAYNELDDSYATTIAIGYYTGMRIAEILALKESDIDFENNEINIHNQLIYSGRNIKEYKVVSKLKTKKSKDTIPLNNQLKEILLEYLKTHHNEYICQKNNQFYYVSYFNRILKNKYGFTCHDLRHTFASTLYENNVDIKTTQELLRHSNIKTTLDIYTHLKENKKLDTVNDVFKTKDVKSMPKSKIN